MCQTGRAGLRMADVRVNNKAFTGRLSNSAEQRSDCSAGSFAFAVYQRGSRLPAIVRTQPPVLSGTRTAVTSRRSPSVITDGEPQCHHQHHSFLWLLNSLLCVHSLRFSSSTFCVSFFLFFSNQSFYYPAITAYLQWLTWPFHFLISVPG